MQLRRDTLLAVVSLALAAGAAQACPKHSTKTAAAVTPPASRATVVAWKPRVWTPVAPNATQAQGLRVAIDPVDGTMGMPSADEMSQQVVITDDTPVSTFRRANGSVFATLDERFAEFAVVTLGPDGKPAWTCVHGTRGAEQFMVKPFVAPRATATAAPAPGTVWEEK